MGQEIAIETKNLTKYFDEVKAVQDVNLKIHKGEIFSLLGPNGSGKTTLIKLLVGLLKPTRGSASLFGHDIQKEDIQAKKTFGYVPDYPEPYPYLTGIEFLNLVGNLRAIEKDLLSSRIDKLSNLFPIKEILYQPIENYSRGNKQKVSFLAALLSEPPLLIIDEPIVGLDPKSIEILEKTLADFATKGGTVLFATHILPFAQRLATRVGFMQNGRIVREDSIKNINIEKFFV